MNIRSIRSATSVALLLVAGSLAGSLAGCGAAHVPTAGQADAGDRFVAARSQATVPAVLDEILVQSTRLPVDATNAELDEIVVTASRLVDGASDGNHDLDEIVVTATRLPGRAGDASADAQIAALVD